MPIEAPLYGPHVLLLLLLLKDFEFRCLAKQVVRDVPVPSFPETSVTLRERQFVVVRLVLFSLPPAFFLSAQDLVGDAGKRERAEVTSKAQAGLCLSTTEKRVKFVLFRVLHAAHFSSSSNPGVLPVTENCS